MDSTTTPRRRWEWWHRQTPTTRRTIRTALTLLVTGLLAAAFGVTTASTHASLGPHRADLHVTLDRQVTVQLGPLGALSIASPLPWPLGVDVVVEEIPSALSPAGGNPLTGLLGDAKAYGQLFSEPEAALHDAVTGLVRDALGRTAVAWSIMLVLLAAGRLASGGRLRDELKAALARPGVAALAGAAALSTVAVVVVPAATPDRPAGYSPAVLDGTPLQGARITGRLADVVAAYGPTVKNAYERNEKFYDEVTRNLTAAYAADPASHAPPSVETPGAGTPAPDQGTDAAAAGPAADPPADPVTLLFVSDLHCNVGMARVITAAMEQSGAQVLLDGGDTVMSGTSVESYCVNAFARAVPRHVPVVVSTGNHDSATTAQQERAAGRTVLSGDVVEVEGVRILGDTDPTVTTVGAGGTRPERNETILAMGRRLADIACAEQRDGRPVDILLVHNPRAGNATMRRGCASLQLSGHWHRTVGPEVRGHAVRYVSASSGGAAPGAATVGPLSAPAALTVVQADRATGVPYALRRITIDKDAQVTLGPWTPLPTAPPADLPDGAAASGAPADQATPGGTPGEQATAPDGATPTP
ncbi:metallophosphoesterase family protein [Georgenia thermotolerans]|uniref:Metallophosphoesterase n=1 Tax=Georgenia thermotolerans TaxID=527326 RepID=A0A7J5URG7_9MICO|nr:metallophosphoesterase [Georgenia thermotolerans]KAE8764820.1 metallophosphoesterase [Georgenia thermotolerans]